MPMNGGRGYQVGVIIRQDESPYTGVEQPTLGMGSTGSTHNVYNSLCL